MTARLCRDLAFETSLNLSGAQATSVPTEEDKHVAQEAHVLPYPAHVRPLVLGSLQIGSPPSVRAHVRVSNGAV